MVLERKKRRSMKGIVFESDKESDTLLVNIKIYKS